MHTQYDWYEALVRGSLNASPVQKKVMNRVSLNQTHLFSEQLHTQSSSAKNIPKTTQPPVNRVTSLYNEHSTFQTWIIQTPTLNDKIIYISQKQTPKKSLTLQTGPEIRHEQTEDRRGNYPADRFFITENNNNNIYMVQRSTCFPLFMTLWSSPASMLMFMAYVHFF